MDFPKHVQILAHPPNLDNSEQSLYTLKKVLVFPGVRGTSWTISSFFHISHLFKFVNNNWQSFTLMASIAYSTWKSLPSGEKVLTPRSYSDLVRNIIHDLKLNISWKDSCKELNWHQPRDVQIFWHTLSPGTCLNSSGKDVLEVQLLSPTFQKI